MDLGLALNGSCNVNAKGLERETFSKTYPNLPVERERWIGIEWE